MLGLNLIRVSEWATGLERESEAYVVVSAMIQPHAIWMEIAFLFMFIRLTVMALSDKIEEASAAHLDKT